MVTIHQRRVQHPKPCSRCPEPVFTIRQTQYSRWPESVFTIDRRAHPRDMAIYDFAMGKKYLEILGQEVPAAWKVS